MPIKLPQELVAMIFGLRPRLVAVCLGLIKPSQPSCEERTAMELFGWVVAHRAESNLSAARFAADYMIHDSFEDSRELLEFALEADREWQRDLNPYECVSA